MAMTEDRLKGVEQNREHHSDDSFKESKREVWAKIIEQIRSAENILVVAHQSPDPDAFGSSCGMTLALKYFGKNALCLNQDGAAPHLQYIPDAFAVTDTVPAGEWDLIIVCDCGEKERIGSELLNQLPQGVPIVNLDHHYSNDNFGDLNLVLPNTSSASEIVFEVVSDLLGTLTPEIAECLLTGIIADTGGFRYSSATAYTFIVAEKLIKAGANLERVNRNLFSNRSLAAVRLAAAAISAMKIHAAGKVVEILVTEEMMQRFSAQPTDCEGLVDAGRDIEGVCVSILIRKDGDLWKVSLRSKYSECNVSEVAATFNGGGHVQAAACRWSGELEDLRSSLLAKVIQVVNDSGK